MKKDDEYITKFSKTRNTIKGQIPFVNVIDDFHAKP